MSNIGRDHRVDVLSGERDERRDSERDQRGTGEGVCDCVQSEVDCPHHC